MGLATVDERRQAAMNQTLRVSYNAYHITIDVLRGGV
jgi:hypothetical protein